MKKAIQRCLIIFVGSVLYAGLELVLMRTPLRVLTIGQQEITVRLGLLVMAVCCCSFGSLVGGFVGFFGALIVGAYGYGRHIFQYLPILERVFRHDLGIAVGNLFAGGILGAGYAGARREESASVRFATHLIFIVLSSGIGLLLVRALIEHMQKGVDLVFWIRRSLYECAASAGILLVSYFVCMALEPILNNIFPSLTKGGEEAQEKDQNGGTDTNGGI